MNDAPDKPAWSPDELSDNPHQRADKARKVRDMFTAIADSYDLNNRVHSFGRDQAWRRKAVKLAALRPGDRVLDVACGTGDLALLFALRLGLHAIEDGWPTPSPSQVIGLDFTFPMLPIAEQKNSVIAEQTHPGNEEEPRLWPGVARFLNGDAMSLPFADQTFDVVSIAFGLRNVADPAAAVREFSRVLRPGGRLVILEFSEPGNPLVRWGSKVWTDHIMPQTATWIARDRSGAYRYLPRSVATFMDRAGVASLFEKAGLNRPTMNSVNFGVATIYVGSRLD
ncbi:MAG: ubiquinone/menaquinone biosynthesis methyltransferase [Planctomycetota bacterium]